MQKRILTLDNFDQQLPKDLLKKALPYFQNGAVLYVDQAGADELQVFLVEYATADKTFATKLQLHFADKDERIDVGKHYTELVRKTIRAHGDRHGYIDYRATFKLAKEVNTSGPLTTRL